MRPTAGGSSGSKSKAVPGTGLMDYAGYSDCVFLKNEDTRVVLGQHCGGRLLEYSWKGKNALALDPTQDGWVYDHSKPVIDPWGGRFDIGPEMTTPSHSVLWLGSWKAEVIGPRVARLTSQVDDVTGVQLVRLFRLAERSSHLKCVQTIRNASKKTKEYCYWSRTLAQGSGICVVPVTAHSRFPNGYVMYGPGPVMNYRPSDPNINHRDGFMEVAGPPSQPKLGFDSYAGWLAYQMRNDLLFVKRFPVYRGRVYNEMAAITISVWYYRDRCCELEPIGPSEIIKPGHSAVYAEEWWLLEHGFPTGQIDLEELRGFVQAHAKR